MQKAGEKSGMRCEDSASPALNLAAREQKQVVARVLRWSYPFANYLYQVFVSLSTMVKFTIYEMKFLHSVPKDRSAIGDRAE